MAQIVQAQMAQIVQAQMATNMYKPKWQQICTSPNSLYINKFKPEASTEAQRITPD